MKPVAPSVLRVNRVRLLMVGCALLFGFACSAFAGAVDWGPPEVISPGVPHVSSPAGSSVVWHAGAWHVVCEKDGGVQYHWRDAAGWHVGPDLAPPGASARDPHLGVCGTGLMAVWSAPSLHEREVFARRGIFSGWSSIEAISDDGIRSQAPVVSGFADERALVVWEDSTSGGFRVRGRAFDGLEWGSTESVSLGTADAREPTLLADPSGFSYYTNWTVAWTDWRQGTPAIYRRDRGEAWGEEVHLTHLSTACRHPAALLARGGDFPFPYPVVAFESTGPAGGAPETWIARDVLGAELVSRDDGIASTGANLGGFNAPFNTCGLMPYSSTLKRIAWRDETPSGAILRSCWDHGIPSAPDSLATSLPAGAIVGAHDGDEATEIMQVWTDLVGGRSTLLARIGTTADCYSEGLRGPTALLLGPSGNPPTRISHVDQCSEEALPGGEADFWIDSELEDQITLDAGQSTYLHAEGDAAGVIEFWIRGGGCATSGLSTASITWNCEAHLTGARSPDVDGDCAVTPTDRAYFVVHLGTSDFCADLDDDGVVTAADLAIVDATMGDICGAASVGDEGALPPIAGDPSRSRILAWPNPARGPVQLAIATHGAATGTLPLRICDASGREVRRLEARPTGAAWSATWDLRNDRGRSAPAGCYFAQAAGYARSGPILVVH